MDRGTWQALVHRIAQSWTQLKQLRVRARTHTHTHTHTQSQFNRTGRPEEGALTPCDLAELDRTFLARTQPMKSHGLLVYYSPPTSFFPPLLKHSLSFAVQGLIS